LVLSRQLLLGTSGAAAVLTGFGTSGVGIDLDEAAVEVSMAILDD